MGVDFAAHLGGIACPALLMQADPARGITAVTYMMEFRSATVSALTSWNHSTDRK